MTRTLTPEIITSEIEFSTSRSGGPGGQNVNKVNSKVTLRWNVTNSQLITAEEKELLTAKWAQRLTTDGSLVIVAQESRSQLQNKEDAVLKLAHAIRQAFIKKKKRKATKPSKSATQSRLDKKKKQGDKKKWRQDRFD